MILNFRTNHSSHIFGKVLLTKEGKISFNEKTS